MISDFKQHDYQIPCAYSDEWVVPLLNTTNGLFDVYFGDDVYLSGFVFMKSFLGNNKVTDLLEVGFTLPYIKMLLDLSEKAMDSGRLLDFGWVTVH